MGMDMDKTAPGPNCQYAACLAPGALSEIKDWKGLGAALRFLVPFLQALKQSCQHNNGGNCQNKFRRELRIGKAIQREEVVKNEKCRDFQDDFTQKGKYESLFAKATCLKYAHGEKIHA